VAIKTKYNTTQGFFQEEGDVDKTNAALEVSPSQTDQEALAVSIDRGMSISTSQTSGIREVSGSLLSLKGRQEGLHFHLGGNQYVSNNCWFDATHSEHPSGRWIYETTSGAAFRWGFVATAGQFDLEWAKSGIAGQVITGSSAATWGTGLSLSASNGAIGIGKKAKNGLSATFDITGSNPIALAVTGSVDIGGAAPDAYIIFPRHTNITRDALNALAGMVIYNTDTNALQYFNGGSWRQISDIAAP
jgi:hypothetical protein